MPNRETMKWGVPGFREIGIIEIQAFMADAPHVTETNQRS